MKIKLATTLFISFLFSVSAWAGLRDQLNTKTSNYNYLQTHYSSLLKLSQSNEGKKFCQTVSDSYNTLVEILNNDGELINELRKIDHPDYQEYATQLEENIASPLFSYGAYMDTCENGDLSDITRMNQAIQYHVMNIEYLKMIHLMWIEGFETI